LPFTRFTLEECWLRLELQGFLCICGVALFRQGKNTVGSLVRRWFKDGKIDEEVKSSHSKAPDHLDLAFGMVLA